MDDLGIFNSKMKLQRSQQRMRSFKGGMLRIIMKTTNRQEELSSEKHV